MRVEGEADDLYAEVFPHGLVSQILRLIVDTWSVFQLPTDGEDEPKITNRFALALQHEGRLRRAQFRIMAHVKDLEKLETATGKGYVEIDIFVPYGYESRCYFGVEAKKLNTTSTGGKWESQAGDYAGKDGMGRFVEDRYASYQCEGAMVGYVMDGDCARAKESISDAIEKKADVLRVAVPCLLHPARHLADYAHAFETKHALVRTEFTIFHVLLAAC